jgi:hypothetical protein
LDVHAQYESYAEPAALLQLLRRIADHCPAGAIGRSIQLSNIECALAKPSVRGAGLKPCAE